MLRPAYLLSTAVLVTAAAIQFEGTTPAMDRSQASAATQHAQPSVSYRLSAPVQTISGIEVIKPAQPQRWVF